MSTYTVQAAKTHLSRLLHEVEAGAEVTILRGRRPVARVTAVECPPRRCFGVLVLAVPEDFDAPLTDDELESWE